MIASRVDADVAVVGAGPAGVAAAACAAEAGAKVVLIDEGLAAGGQIWRGAGAAGGHLPAAACRWLARLERSGAHVLTQATVADAQPGGLLVAAAAGVARVRATHTVLATGARELFLPFPGWTLPGVVGVGGLQALVKSGAELRGQRVAVAGSGPLLLPVAATVRAAGGRLVTVAEQAPFGGVARFATGLWRRPAKLLEAAAYRARFAGTRQRFGCHVLAAHGDHALRAVELTDGRRSWTEDCDLLACGYGLVPNVELARLLECALHAEGGVAVDGRQRTSVAGVLAAGEVTGVAGAEAALVEGEIAGKVAALGDAADVERLASARDAWRRFARDLAHAFRPREELRHAVRDDTLVCRCEDVAWGRLRGLGSAREAKLATRLGMGACQGRTCGPALEFLCGFARDSVRAPLVPVPVEALLED